MEKYLINPNQKLSHINKDVYGNFSEHLGRCIYEGLYVGEDSPIPNVNGMRCDVVNALKDMGLPVLRWPGGCFADEYHWKDGIGPKENRKKMINTHWGGVVEDNSFGTHEFFELCRQIGCDPYITGNVGSGTVQEMSEWVEYMTLDGVSPMADLRKENGREEPWNVKYFGVGNENWGCGGNMTPEFYADQYRRYATFVRTYDPKRKAQKIACGPNNDDYHWTEVLMKNAAPYMDGLSLHYYTLPTGNWQNKGSSTQYTTEVYYDTLRRSLHMEELVTAHSAIMDKYDPEKRIGLIVDEWGTWYDVEPGTNPGFLYQQSTMRDAMVAGLNLNIFNKHADRVQMANIAQTVNVLQSVILTDGDRMVLTPTYHVFDLYKVHQGAQLVASTVAAPEVSGIPAVHESASIKEDGTLSFTICNFDAENAQQMRTVLSGTKAALVSAQILYADDIHACNDFEEGSPVALRAFDNIEVAFDGNDTVLTYTLPACSVARVTVK